MSQHNIIELNGKQYDALTGALLGQSKITATPATKAAHLKRLNRQGQAVDGFIRHSRPANNLKPQVVKPSVHPKQDSTSAASSVASPAKQVKHTGGKSIGGIARVKSGQPAAPREAKALSAHRPEKPKTLMRHVVKKPASDMKPAIKTTAPAEMMARPTSTLAKPLEKKLSVSQVNPARLGRARQIPKSQHIRRFTRERTAERQQQYQAQAGTTTAVHAQRSGQYAARPVRQDFRPSGQSAVQGASGMAQHHMFQKTSASHAGTQPAPQRASHTDIFEAALAHANSHEQKPVQTRRQTMRRKRLMSLAAGLGAFLVIAGFIAYLNKPALELRVASMRAGFHAQMPGYKPTGYALEGGVKTTDGKVAMQFRSGENAYVITQEASDWNSSTLLDQTATDRGAPTRTIQSKGRTIYIYNDTSATWVNGGVHYEISGNSSMDAGELVSLATSM